MGNGSHWFDLNASHDLGFKKRSNRTGRAHLAHERGRVQLDMGEYCFVEHLRV